MQPALHHAFNSHDCHLHAVVRVCDMLRLSCMQMRVEELEAVCHAASFESSLRRAMANTSPICSVSPSTDSNASSQSCLHDHASASRHQEAASSFFHGAADTHFRTAGIAPGPLGPLNLQFLDSPTEKRQLHVWSILGTACCQRLQ